MLPENQILPASIPTFPHIFVLMIKWFQTLCLCLAVITVLGHGMISHHHDDDADRISHHDAHEDHDDDHDYAGHTEHSDNNPFSFKYLDHLYSNACPAHVSLDIDQYFILRTREVTMIAATTTCSWMFILKNEHPPPFDYSHTISLRGPPSSC